MTSNKVGSACLLRRIFVQFSDSTQTRIIASYYTAVPNMYGAQEASICWRLFENIRRMLHGVARQQQQQYLLLCGTSVPLTTLWYVSTF